jgi:hypothetical protein
VNSMANGTCFNSKSTVCGPTVDLEVSYATLKTWPPDDGPQIGRNIYRRGDEINQYSKTNFI